MHRRYLHIFRAVAAVAAFVLLAAGCGGEEGDGSEAAPATLLVWVGGGPGGEATQKVATEFAKELGVKVTVQLVPGDKLQTQFVTAAQAGKGPDVVMGAHDWIGNLVQNGSIDPIQLSEEARQSVQPVALKAVSFNGQLYGIPYTMNNLILFRNTELAPQQPKTIEEMVARGKQLKSEGKVTQIFGLPVGPNGNAYHINALYTSAGGYMFGTLPNGDYNPEDLGVAKPEAQAAYKKIAALGEKGEGALKRSITSENLLPLFTGGKVAYMLDGPWQFSQLAKTDVKYDVTAIPPFAGGKPARPFITVDAAYVASGAQNKPLAQEFVTSFWLRPEVQLALFKANPSVPALKAVLAQIKASDPMVVKAVEVGNKNGEIMPSIPAMAAVWGPLGVAGAAVIGGADPESSVASAAKAIQAEIK